MCEQTQIKLTEPLLGFLGSSVFRDPWIFLSGYHNVPAISSPSVREKESVLNELELNSMEVYVTALVIQIKQHSCCLVVVVRIFFELAGDFAFSLVEAATTLDLGFMRHSVRHRLRLDAVVDIKQILHLETAFFLRSLDECFEFVGDRAVSLSSEPDERTREMGRQHECEGQGIESWLDDGVVISDNGNALSNDLTLAIVMNPVSSVLLAPMSLLLPFY